MSELIHDIAADQLLSHMQANMNAFWRVYGRGKGADLHSSPKVLWFYTGIKFPLFNGVLPADLSIHDLQTVIESLRAKINRHGAPALWWLGPLAKPDNLGTLLEQQGLQPAGEIPGMALDMTMLAALPATIPNFRIQKVAGVEMQTIWARTAALGTGFSNDATDALASLEASLGDEDYRAQQRYLGFLNGVPVASSALVLEGGVAGIYAVATVPEARRKGIGTMMTVVPLLEAREKGYRVAILQASSEGYPIYRDIGFKTVCDYKLYLQPK